MMTIWDNTYSSLYKKSLPLLNINRDDSLKILDLGIGSGMSTKYLADYFKNSYILGIDYSNIAVQKAKDNNKELIESNRVSIIVGDVEKLILNKNSYDLACAFQTHFHWNNFEKYLSNIYNILKKDGILLIACEANKLKYHLKKYSKFNEFNKLIIEIGYSKTDEVKDGNIIIYIVQK